MKRPASSFVISGVTSAPSTSTRSTKRSTIAQMADVTTREVEIDGGRMSLELGLLKKWLSLTPKVSARIPPLQPNCLE